MRAAPNRSRYSENAATHHPCSSDLFTKMLLSIHVRFPGPHHFCESLYVLNGETNTGSVLAWNESSSEKKIQREVGKLQIRVAESRW